MTTTRLSQGLRLCAAATLFMCAIPSIASADLPGPGPRRRPGPPDTEPEPQDPEPDEKKEVGDKDTKGPEPEAKAEPEVRPDSEAKAAPAAKVEPTAKTASATADGDKKTSAKPEAKKGCSVSGSSSSWSGAGVAFGLAIVAGFMLRNPRS